MFYQIGGAIRTRNKPLCRKPGHQNSFLQRICMDTRCADSKGETLCFKCCLQYPHNRPSHLQCVIWAQLPYLCQRLESELKSENREGIFSNPSDDHSNSMYRGIEQKLLEIQSRIGELLNYLQVQQTTQNSDFHHDRNGDDMRDIIYRKELQTLKQNLSVIASTNKSSELQNAVFQITKICEFDLINGISMKSRPMVKPTTFSSSQQNRTPRMIDSIIHQYLRRNNTRESPNQFFLKLIQPIEVIDAQVKILETIITPLINSNLGNSSDRYPNIPQNQQPSNNLPFVNIISPQPSQNNSFLSSPNNMLQNYQNLPKMSFVQKSYNNQQPQSLPFNINPVNVPFSRERGEINNLVTMSPVSKNQNRPDDRENHSLRNTPNPNRVLASNQKAEIEQQIQLILQKYTIMANQSCALKEFFDMKYGTKVWKTFELIKDGVEYPFSLRIDYLFQQFKTFRPGAYHYCRKDQSNTFIHDIWIHDDEQNDQKMECFLCSSLIFECFTVIELLGD